MVFKNGKINVCRENVMRSLDVACEFTHPPQVFAEFVYMMISVDTECLHWFTNVPEQIKTAKCPYSV